MITAGIDVGAKTVKMVLLADGTPLAKKKTLVGLDTASALEEVVAAVLAEAGGLARDQIDFVVGTGAGQDAGQVFGAVEPHAQV